MGSEFSFLHFAIVLDKKDNSKKRTLTVIPLTSKQKSGRFPLGKEIFNQTITIINSRIEENEDKHRRIQQNINKITNEIADLVNDFLDAIIENNCDYKEELKQFKISDDEEDRFETNNLLKELTKYVEKNNHLEYSDELLPKFNEQLELMANESKNLSKDASQLNKETLDLQKVIDIYQGYNKNSYVRLTDVTTISKFRIKRLNRFDSSGKIQLSSEQMKVISDELMKLYIS
ncbi:hypothetical protein M5C72_10855 [Companilactobacillus allii]|uniref:Uncharacterized protein n=2 Tax=Companilactobacillus allii TaxID=1847728 RepID=A0A1P8Q094_9LACO|nr:hypothetical protein BTM29_01225 [Companilactobacillus allii]USQ68337.1 hypothetical protein M5C72_10855 [Companilactobacillus allii]